MLEKFQGKLEEKNEADMKPWVHGSLYSVSSWPQNPSKVCV